MKTSLSNTKLGKWQHTRQWQEGWTMTTNWRVINWRLTAKLVNGKTWAIANLDNNNKLIQWQKIWTVTKNWPMKTNLVNENKYERYQRRNRTKKSLDNWKMLDCDNKLDNDYKIRQWQRSWKWNAKLDDDDRFRQGQTRFSEVPIHHRSCLHEGNSVQYSWQEKEWRLRVTYDVVGGITERPSDSRNRGKEVTILQDASVRGYPRRNTTSWTVLKLEVTALISFKASRNVNPATPQQEWRNLIFSNTAVRTWNLAVNIPDSVDTAATLFRPPKYRADVTGLVKLIVFKYVWKHILIL